MQNARIAQDLRAIFVRRRPQGTLDARARGCLNRRMRTGWIVGALVAVGAGVGVLAACVGDDPATPVVEAGAPDAPVVVPPEAAPGVDASAPDGDAGEDPRSCGAPGHDCQGGACVGGKCQPVVLATTQNRPIQIAVDGDHLYWVNAGSLDGAGTACDPVRSDGSVVRSSLDGTGLTRVADGLPCPGALAVGPDGVYFSTAAGPGQGAIWRVPKSGPPVAPVAVYTGLGLVYSLLFDGPTLYWSEDAQSGRVMRGLADGGAPSVFAYEQVNMPRALRAEGASLYWITGYNNVGGNALGQLRGAPKASPGGGFDGGATSLVAPLRLLTAMTTDATRAFYAFGGEGQPGKIDTYTFGSGARATLLEGTNAELIRGLAVDGTHVFVAGRYQSITRVELATGKAERFVTVQEFCTGIAVDATSVYVTSTEAGKVRRVRKPAP